MFSKTTIASSTTIPIAMESADIEMIFNVFPVAKRYTREPSNAIGIERTMMNVALHLHKKTNTTSMTTRRVMIMVSLRELIVFRISEELSTTSVILISEGRVGAISAILCFAAFTTLTVFAPDCFWIAIMADRFPLV